MSDAGRSTMKSATCDLKESVLAATTTTTTTLAPDASSSEVRYINDDLGVLGEYGARNVKMKSCEEKEVDGIVPFFRRMTCTEMFEAGLIKNKETISSEELMKLGMTEDDFYDDGERDMTEDEKKLYITAVRESGGYDVPDFPDVDNDGLIQPIHKLEAYIEDLTTSINLAIQENVPDSKLVKILKANYQGWNYFYITFEAQEANGEIQTYQTKVNVGFPWLKMEMEVEEFRLKPSI